MNENSDIPNKTLITSSLGPPAAPFPGGHMLTPPLMLCAPVLLTHPWILQLLTELGCMAWPHSDSAHTASFVLTSLPTPAIYCPDKNWN